MDLQSGETIDQTMEIIKNGKRKWTDDEVQVLIELLEEKLCGIFFRTSIQKGR